MGRSPVGFQRRTFKRFTKPLTNTMKKLVVYFLMTGGMLLNAPRAGAQFIVADPMHTGVTTLIKMITDPSFKTMVKNIEKLKKVTSSVQQFHRGTRCV